LVESLNSILGKDIKPEHTDPRPGDVKHSRADISKAKRLLGFKEVRSFEEGLNRTVEYFISGM
ncbi:MAG: LPS biosynthesis protein WbpP, partial [Thermoplasmata archaeon]|nr:LPS biosynthesis protein WbpP [Thermoplasmata archaeon]